MSDYINSYRREFIKNGALTTAGILFASHFWTIESSSKIKSQQNLISHIKLQTKVSVEEMIDFYYGKIGLKVLSKSKSHCSFVAGKSTLTFTCDVGGEDPPFYHFAFNIPEKKIRETEEWHLKRSDIIEPPEHLKDLKNYSKNIVHFRHWDAHSVFFYDPAGNIVEYIARHTDPNPAIGKFSTDDILYISEIGLVVDNVQEIYKDITNIYDLKKYSTGSDQFMALGNEQGLLLLMGANNKSIFGRGRVRGIYGTEVILNHEKALPIREIENYPYQIRVT